jgi:hypothetical protein
VKLVVKKCHHGSTQKFKRECGAWSSGHGKGKRVMHTNGKTVYMDKYYGEKAQLWHYKEFVRHSRCSKKRYKVMKFHGHRGTTVMLPNLLSIPDKEITVSMWLKPQRGVPFSYASKHHVAAFVVELPFSTRKPCEITLYVKDSRLPTKVRISRSKWTHVAASWRSKTGEVKMYVNGKLKYRKKGIKRGTKITSGGCLLLGQKAKQACKTRIKAASYKGRMTDVMIWKGILNPKKIFRHSYLPVSEKVLAKVGKLTAPRPPSNLRAAWLSRQYGSQELGKNKRFPPVCKLVKQKRAIKKIRGPGGWMSWGGTGDVHYRDFNNCKYDDQSVGEWAAVEMQKKYFRAYPLRITYRTSPNRQRCSWCQNGAVSYIDGCAVEYKGDQASAGFGGFNFPNSNYRPYASFKSKKATGGWQRSRFMRARCARHSMHAILTDGSMIRCARASINIRVPRKLQGKVGGMAGNGLRGQWIAGPNRRVSGIKPYRPVPGLRGCFRNYQYGNPRSPFNGNSPNKPIVKLLKSWQVDSRGTVKSAFRYCCGRNAGSFNRVAGQKIKPIKKVSSNRPTGAKKKAKHACRVLRNNKKYFKKCIFDYFVLGAKAVRKNLKDRMRKRRGKVKTPGAFNVRDLSRWRNDAKWVGAPSWGCVDGFAKLVNKIHKKHATAAHKQAFMSKNCQCKARYLGECAYDHFICIAHRKLTEYRSLLASHVYGK